MNPNPSPHPVNPVHPVQKFVSPSPSADLSLAAADAPSARTGKIARLPAHLRLNLNRRLDDSQPANAILAWLNSHPEVRQIIHEQFQDIPISPQNLSEWRQGGFREWLLLQECLHHANQLHSASDSLTAVADPTALADNLATVLAARYAAILNTWDGEPAESFEAKLRILRALTRDVLALQKSLHRAADLRQKRDLANRQAAAEDLQKEKDRAHNIITQRNRAFLTSVHGPAIADAAVAARDARTLEEVETAIQSVQSNQIKPNPHPVNLVNPVQLTPPPALTPVSSNSIKPDTTPIPPQTTPLSAPLPVHVSENALSS